MPGGGVEDVDRAGAGAARRDALEKKGAEVRGGYHLLVERRLHGPYSCPVEHGRLYCTPVNTLRPDTVERHSLYSMQKESTALAVPILELKCVWQFPKKFPLALNYYSRFLL